MGKPAMGEAPIGYVIVKVEDLKPGMVYLGEQNEPTEVIEVIRSQGAVQGRPMTYSIVAHPIGKRDTVGLEAIIPASKEFLVTEGSMG